MNKLAHEQSLSGRKVALIGCGDIGNRLALQCVAAGAEVSGFRRNANKVVAEAQAFAMDVTDKQSLQPLADHAFDYVVISLTPDISAKNRDKAAVAAAYHATYVEGLKNILGQLNTQRLKKLIWVSSTSVYAQDDNSWVDENSDTCPQRTSGQKLLEAEQLLRQWDASQALNKRCCIVRFSGIYREHSHRLLTQLQAGTLAAQVDRDYYTNRIHIQDCVSLLLFLMQQDAMGQKLDAVYLGTDNSPVLYTELVAFLAEAAKLPLQQTLLAKKPGVGSKRCSNKRITEAGFRFSYGSYQQGFMALLAKEAAAQAKP